MRINWTSCVSSWLSCVKISEVPSQESACFPANMHGENYEWTLDVTWCDYGLSLSIIPPSFAYDNTS